MVPAIETSNRLFSSTAFLGRKLKKRWEKNSKNNNFNSYTAEATGSVKFIIKSFGIPNLQNFSKASYGLK